MSARGLLAALGGEVVCGVDPRTELGVAVGIEIGIRLAHEQPEYAARLLAGLASEEPWTRACSDGLAAIVAVYPVEAWS